MATVEFSPDLIAEYNHLFALATIRPENKFEIDAVVTRIFDPQSIAQYRQVETAIGVPSHVIGIIHSLEASLRFDRHLHNGDPLTARTVQVPAGRPADKEPPFEWTDSAIDALKLDHLDKWTDWSVAGIAFVLERFNGFGYRLHHPHVKSPYLWGFTTIYTAGRYVADGVFSDTAVSRQCGGMALLKRMIELRKIEITPPALPRDTTDVEEAPKGTLANGGVPPLTAPPPFPGHLLKLDSNGKNVTAVQTRLRALGIEAGGVDGDYGDSTKAAVKLFQARSVDESGAPLEIDGVVGEKTWSALFGVAAPRISAIPPTAGSLTAEVLRIAAAEVGVREVPLGSNRGPRVDQYLNSVGPGLLGQPWCMAFIYFCFNEAANAAGVPNPAPRTGGVKRSWELAQTRHDATIVPAEDAAADPSLVVPGMIFYLDTGPGTGHAGFVADVIGTTLVTVEGNTAIDGGREGIGVFHRSKSKINEISIGFAGFA